MIGGIITHSCPEIMMGMNTCAKQVKQVLITSFKMDIHILR